MSETLTETPDVYELPSLESDRRMSCERASLIVKVVGTVALSASTLGATGDLATALFVGVGYATALVCVTVLPLDEIPTPRVRVKSRTKHQ